MQVEPNKMSKSDVGIEDLIGKEFDLSSEETYCDFSRLPQSWLEDEEKCVVTYYNPKGIGEHWYDIIRLVKPSNNEGLALCVHLISRCRTKLLFDTSSTHWDPERYDVYQMNKQHNLSDILAIGKNVCRTFGKFAENNTCQDWLNKFNVAAGGSYFLTGYNAKQVVIGAAAGAVLYSLKQ